MPTICVELEGCLIQIGQVDTNFPADSPWDRRTNLIEVDFKPAFDLANLAMTRFVKGWGPARIASPALRHAPAPRRAVKGHVDRAVIGWVSPFIPSVIGRKNTADKDDNHESMFAIVADAINIPPGITAGGRRVVK